MNSIFDYIIAATLSMSGTLPMFDN